MKLDIKDVTKEQNSTSAPTASKYYVPKDNPHFKSEILKFEKKTFECTGLKPKIDSKQPNAFFKANFKVALLIGNTKYDQVPNFKDIAQAPEDLKTMTEMVKKYNFDRVHIATNGNN